MADVIHQDEIFINGLRYRLAGPIRLRSLDMVPQQIRETAFSQMTAPAKVTRVLTNVRGGGGLYRVRPEEGDVPVRVWDGLAWTLSTPLVPLPPLATSAGTPLADTDFYLLFEYNGIVWAVVGSDVYLWSGPSGTAWSGSQRTLTSAIRGVAQHSNGGTNRLFLLCGGNIDYYDGTTWAQVASTDADYGVSYNSFLWVIDEDGNFRRDASGIDAWGAWTTRSALPLHYGQRVRGLAMYRDPAGDPAIYAKTTSGLWAYDDTNDKWYPTELQVPNTPETTTAIDSWRGLGLPETERSGLYVGVGLGVYGYVSGDPAEIHSIGLDTLDGQPSGYGGSVYALAPAHNFNLATISAPAHSTGDAEYGEADVGALGGTEVIPGHTGRTWLTAYTGLGWHKLWESAATDITGGPLLVATAYNEYRVYWVANRTMYWMDLPTGILNPREITDRDYAAAGRLIYPWDTGSREGAYDLLIELRIRTLGCTPADQWGAGETVTVNYATDFDDSTWTAPVHATFTNGVITSDGLHTFTFGTSARGVLFDSIRFRLQGERGSAVTDKPQVDYLAYDFVPSLDPVLLWEIPVDVREQYGQRHTADQLSTLLNLADPQILRELIWRNQSSSTDDVHQCKLIGIQGAAPGGPYEEGVYVLSFLEPRS